MSLWIVEVQMYPSEPNTGKLENPQECWGDCAFKEKIKQAGQL